MIFRYVKYFILLIAIASLSSSCSINKMVINRLADSLSSGDSLVFTGEDDPELVGDALPFALKLYESLLEQNPDHEKLLLSTGQAFTMYAYAYVQFPAEQLPDKKIKKKKEMLARAKKLYLRGRSYILRALQIRHKGFTNAVNKNNMESALKLMDKQDVPYLYWGGLAWMGAFTTDPFDFELSISKTKAVSMLQKVLDMDESYSDGAVHNFFITYYGSLPPEMGGSDKKAREHFKRSVELSKGLSASPYVSLATAVSIKNQNIKEFKELLQKALDINVNKKPEIRLANILDQRKAKWMMEHLDNYFLLDEKGVQEE